MIFAKFALLTLFISSIKGDCWLPGGSTQVAPDITTFTCLDYTSIGSTPNSNGGCCDVTEIAAGEMRTVIEDTVGASSCFSNFNVLICASLCHWNQTTFVDYSEPDGPLMEVYIEQETADLIYNSCECEPLGLGADTIGSVYPTAEAFLTAFSSDALNINGTDWTDEFPRVDFKIGTSTTNSGSYDQTFEFSSNLLLDCTGNGGSPTDDTVGSLAFALNLASDYIDVEVEDFDDEDDEE